MSTTYKARCIYGGMFERIIPVTVDRRLQTMPAAQAGIIDGIIMYDQITHRAHKAPGVTLMSYATPAATLTAGGILTIDCLCSASTRRHVSAFLREFAPAISYQDAKAAHIGGYSIDITTGDHIDRETGEIINANREEAA